MPALLSTPYEPITWQLLLEKLAVGLSGQGWTSVLLFSKLLLVTATQLVRNQSDLHFCRVEWESSPLCLVSALCFCLFQFLVRGFLG